MSSFTWVARVAFRSLGRNPRRSVIAAIGIAVGVSLCIATFGIVDGLDGDIVRGVTDAELGHVQVHAHGYLETHALAKVLHESDRLVQAVERALPGASVAPRAYGWGLATSRDQSIGVELMGVDPPREAKVTTLAKKLIAGEFLQNGATPWPDAKPLSPAEAAKDAALTQSARAEALAELDALAGDTPGRPQEAGETSRDIGGQTAGLVRELMPPPSQPLPAVVGVALAQKLKLAVGDRVQLGTQGLDGAPRSVPAKVVGIFQTGTASIDRTRIMLHEQDVRHLLGLGTDAHELAIRLARADEAADAAQRLRASPDFAALDVQGWQELRPDVTQFVQADEGLMEALLFIVFLIAALGVANTMMMAVFERKVELGVLKALGMPPRTILVLVVVETALLSVAGCAAGVAIGLVLDGLLAHFGWNLSSIGKFSLVGVGIDPTLHAQLTLRGVVMPVATILGIAVLGSLYPALFAARLEPAVGMRESS